MSEKQNDIHFFYNISSHRQIKGNQCDWSKYGLSSSATEIIDYNLEFHSITSIKRSVILIWIETQRKQVNCLNRIYQISEQLKFYLKNILTYQRLNYIRDCDFCRYNYNYNFVQLYYKKHAILLNFKHKFIRFLKINRNILVFCRNLVKYDVRLA